MPELCPDGRENLLVVLAPCLEQATQVVLDRDVALKYADRVGLWSSRNGPCAGRFRRPTARDALATPGHERWGGDAQGVGDPAGLTST